jgi:mRNA interferase RelE/StbE
MYALEFHPLALKEWHALDNSIRQELLPVLEKRLLNPFVPSARLRDELSGYYKIKLQRLGIRLIYLPDGDKLIVTVISIGKRENSSAYRTAAGRVES